MHPGGMGQNICTLYIYTHIYATYRCIWRCKSVNGRWLHKKRRLLMQIFMFQQEVGYEVGELQCKWLQIQLNLDTWEAIRLDACLTQDNIHILSML